MSRTSASRLVFLMVDDDHNDQALFGYAIDTADLDIWLQTALDVPQAIDYLEGHEGYADRLLHPIPDLVLLDLTMPHPNGFDFLALRQASRAFCALPVVLLTGSTDPSEIQRAVAMGVTRHITKPQGIADLKNVIQTLWQWGMELSGQFSR